MKSVYETIDYTLTVSPELLKEIGLQGPFWGRGSSVSVSILSPCLLRRGFTRIDVRDDTRCAFMDKII